MAKDEIKIKNSISRSKLFLSVHTMYCNAIQIGPIISYPHTSWICLSTRKKRCMYTCMYMSSFSELDLLRPVTDIIKYPAII
jgi:hypothetical protein